MTKNLHSLNGSVEEETEESNRGEGIHSKLEVTNCQPFQLSTIALASTALCTFHHTYSPESHSYYHIAYLTLPQFLPYPEANHYTCTHMDGHTVHRKFSSPGYPLAGILSLSSAHTMSNQVPNLTRS